MCVDDTPRGQRTPAQVIRRKQTRRVPRVCQGQVHEDALEEDEGAASIEGDADDADDPVDILFTGPAKPEHSCREECCGEEGRDKTGLLGAEAVLLDVGFQVVVDVGDVDDDADHTADDDASEDHT